MIPIKNIDEALSVKIGDYIKDNGEGEIFKSAHRLMYIERAYDKLIRYLNKIMREKSPSFCKHLNFIEIFNSEIVKIKENTDE